MEIPILYKIISEGGKTMDVKININGKEKGSIPYDSLAAFFYFSQECGYDINWDSENKKVSLFNGLYGKKISLSSISSSDPIRKKQLEQKMLQHIQSFIANTGAEVTLQKENEPAKKNDVNLTLALSELRSLKKTVLELACNSISNNSEKWLSILSKECQKDGIPFHTNALQNTTPNTLALHFMYPEMNDEQFWNTYGENYAIKIAMAILARLQGDSPLAMLSVMPLANFSVPFNMSTSISPETREKKPFVQSSGHNDSTKVVKSEQKRTEAEVYFDYHLILDKELERIKIIGNLHIKNTGTEILRYPVICLRQTPANQVKISGQIVPPNVVETKSVMSDSGAKGWKYMNEDWFEQEEKGETWIAPIHNLLIHPKQTESLQNIQMTINNIEDKEKILLEAFVFFKEQQLEFISNNRISLIF